MNRIRALWQRLPRWVGIVAVLVAVLLLAVIIRYRLWIFATNHPQACITCHLMDSNYQSWQHSEHSRDANCTDCHVSQSAGVVGAYYHKAKSGLRHVSVYVMTPAGQRDKIAVTATAETKEVVEENCLRCHADIDPLMQAGAVSMDRLDQAKLKRNGSSMPELTNRKAAENSCLRCHADTAHPTAQSIARLKTQRAKQVPIPVY